MNDGNMSDRIVFAISSLEKNFVGIIIDEIVLSRVSDLELKMMKDYFSMTNLANHRRKSNTLFGFPFSVDFSFSDKEFIIKGRRISKTEVKTLWEEYNKEK